MPALATSKRKFEKLLDSLTPPAPRGTDRTSTPPSSSPANKENRDEDNAAGDPTTPSRSAKRIRLSAQARRTPTTIRSTGTTTTFSPSRRTRLLHTPSKTTMEDKPQDAEKREPPNYAPWSHDLFLERLKTFADVLIWTSKPDEVNEVQWAKRGWSCESVNKVACKGGCERRLAIVLRPKRKDKEGFEIEGSEDYSVDVDEGLVKRYQELIVTAHEEYCLWRLDKCKDDIYRLPIARPSIWQPQIAHRYHSFTPISTSVPSPAQLLHTLKIPYFAKHLPANLNFTRSETPTSNSSDAPLDHRFLAFALHGWSAHPSTHNPTATCSACFRRIPLWLFQSNTSDAAKETEAPADSSPRGLDLIGNHRDYCPWVNGGSQCMPGELGGLPAWRILEIVVGNWIARRVGDEGGDEAADVSQEANGPSTPTAGGGGGAGIAPLGGNGTSKPMHSHSSRPSSAAQGSEGGSSRKSREEVEKQDKARFARLRELTRGLTRMKKRRDRVGGQGLGG
ncbi:MAG: hypothetical protein M1831_004081 [Alyxoria varia]|nr:MAG: hypothetical protein M1831_004081 [Alyxoria varia]